MMTRVRKKKKKSKRQRHLGNIWVNGLVLVLRFERERKGREGRRVTIMTVMRFVPFCCVMMEFEICKDTCVHIFAHACINIGG